jgi:hypothetical protein
VECRRMEKIGCQFLSLNQNNAIKSKTWRRFG